MVDCGALNDQIVQAVNYEEEGYIVRCAPSSVT